MKKIYLFSIFLSGFFISSNPVLSQTISNLSNNTFTENSSPIVIDSDVSVSGGGGYGGGYILFDLTNGSVGDQLGLVSDADPNVAGAISFSGGNLYLGNGSGKDIIGSIDAILNGQNGTDLKINFTSNFQNSSFESGLGGWTVQSSFVDLGVTFILGFTSPNDPTPTPYNNTDGDSDYPSTLYGWYNEISTSQYTDGTHSLRLWSSMTTAEGCDVVHGPYVYSSIFSSTVNDVIYFDWRAYAGSDAYDVFGYILNVNTGVATIVLDQTGSSYSGSSPWATASVTIPATGDYRFVFVSGTYDFTCGRAAGASLYIDNVRVYGDKVNDAVASAIMRKITYQNACGTSDATRNLQVSVRNNLGATGTASSTIDLITFPPIPPFTSYTTSLSFPSGGSTPLSSWAHLIMPFNDPIPAGAIITGADLTFTAVDQGWGGTGYPAYLFINATHIGDAKLFHTSTTNTINYAGQFPDYNFGGVNTLEMGFQGYPGWQAFWQGGTLTIHYKINIGNNNLTVALNNLGSVTITPAQIDPGYTDDCGIVSRTLSKSTFTCSDIGANSVTLTVTDTYGNSASGTSTVTVVDNVPPAALCKNITVYLNTGGTASITAAQVDNGSNDACGIASLVLNKTSFNCSNIGANTVTLTVTDVNSNVSTATANVTIADNQTPTITCPANQTIASCVTVIPDYTTSAVIADNCLSGLTVTQNPVAGTAISSGATVTVTLTVKDASNNSASCTFTVTRPDITPVAVNDVASICAGSSVTFSVLDNDSHPQGATLTISDHTNPSVGTLVKNPNNTFTYNSVTPSASPVTFTYTIKSNDGVIPYSENNHYYEWVPAVNIPWQQAKAQAATRFFNGMQGYLVTVTSAAEMAFVTSKLQGQGWMGASDLAYEGTWRWVTGPEGLENGGLGRHFSNQFKTGNCSANQAPGINGNYANWAGGEPNDCGANVGQFTPTDQTRGGEHYAHFYGEGIWNDYPNSVGAITGYIVEYGGMEPCTPVLTATATVTITVNPKPVLTAVTTNVICLGGNNGAIDLTVTSGLSPYTYSWSNGATTQDINNLTTGTYTVTVTDANGCSSQSSFTIIQVDNVAPVVVAQNITVQLDQNGTASITAAQINNGSTDNCGIASMTVTPSTFNCSNVGANTVTLTVTDVNGNVSAGTAVVTVQDKIAPVVLTKNLTFYFSLVGQSQVAITASSVDNGSYDNCGIATIEIDKNVFDCSDLGNNTVNVTVTDVNNNVSKGTAIVTIIDDVAPVAVTKDITIQLDATGHATLSGSEVVFYNYSCDRASSAFSNVSQSFTAASSGYITKIGAGIGLWNTPATYSTTITSTSKTVNYGTLNYSGRCCYSSCAPGNNMAFVTLPTPFSVNAGETVTISFSGSGGEKHYQNGQLRLYVTGTAPSAAAIDAGSFDNCSIADMQVDKSTFDCSNVGANTVTLSVTDINGNVSTATAVVTVQDITAPVAIAQNVTVQLDASGNGSTTAQLVDNGSNDACGIKSLVLSKTAFTCADIATNPNVVTLTVTDNNNNISSNTATVTVIDNVKPVVKTKDITVQLDATGKVSIVPADIDNGSTDNCDIATYVLDDYDFSCADIKGLLNTNNTVTVTLTVTDIHGNINSKTAEVTVEDKVVPVVKTKDITVQLDATGNASITTAMINDGSTDNCGIATYALDIDDFTCADIKGLLNTNNTVTVTLTVTDIHGNVNTKTAVVTVEDKIVPVVKTKDITVQLDASGNASITTDMINDGSTDNCGIATYALDDYDFTCADIKGLLNTNNTVTVTLTVTDIHGNINSKTAVVTVEDKVVPVVKTKNITVQLNASGNASITTDMINDGSTDNCGIATYALDDYDFTCADIKGLLNTNNTVTVTLTVTDIHGNVNTKTAVVTVEDKVVPVVKTKDITVQLDASGNASITTAMINDGSTDNCGIATYTLDDYDFSCADIKGLLNTNNTVTVTLTVTDIHGNVNTKTAVVTVEDHVKPVITCIGDDSRYVDPYQTYYTVVGTEFDATAADACGVEFLTYMYNGLPSPNFPTLANRQLNVGTHTFVWTAVDVNGNSSDCTTVVTVLKRPTTLTYDGDLEEQYSDQTNLSAILIDVVSGSGVIGKTITFTIGTQSVTAVTNTNGLATATLVLTQSPIPTYNVLTTFIEDGSYLGSSDNDVFDITPEDARVNFTGTHLVATQSSTSGLATVTLRATVQDITAVTGDPAYDSFAGDIRNARVKFTIDGIDLNGWLTPTLINSTDLKTGVVTYNWTVDIGNAAAEEFTVGIEVNSPGYYIQSDYTVVTVYKPVGDFITGGGYILPVMTAGTYAADPGLKTNFGFNVGYNKSGKNIHGNMNIIFRKTVGGIVHTFQIKANAMTSLGVDISNPAAQVAVFVSKANLKDITNPLTPVSLGGNLTLQVNLTDKGEPGSMDQIAISLYDGNTLMYSSNWTGSATGEILLSGGNLVVHSGFSVTLTKSAEIATATAPVLQYSNLKVYPNPFNDRVRFEFVSPDAVNAQIYIYDMAGRRIETVFEGPVEGGVINKVDFIPRAIANGMYMYRMILGKTVYDGKIEYKK